MVRRDSPEWVGCLATKRILEQKRRLFQYWPGNRGFGTKPTPKQRKEILQMVVDEVIVHRNDNVDITLAIPIESEPTTEDSVSVQTLANVITLEPSS